MFPNYLFLGMTHDQFWHGKAKLTRAYIRAEKIRRENRHQEEWRMGFYVYQAALAANCQTSPYVRGVKPEYPDKPVFTTRSKEEIEQEKQRAQMDRNKQLFMAMVAKANEKLAAKKLVESEEG